jgi:hypothetical protein
MCTNKRCYLIGKNDWPLLEKNEADVFPVYWTEEEVDCLTENIDPYTECKKQR